MGDVVAVLEAERGGEVGGDAEGERALRSKEVARGARGEAGEVRDGLDNARVARAVPDDDIAEGGQVSAGLGEELEVLVGVAL